MPLPDAVSEVEGRAPVRSDGGRRGEVESGCRGIEVVEGTRNGVGVDEPDGRDMRREGSTLAACGLEWRQLGWAGGRLGATGVP